MPCYVLCCTYFSYMPGTIRSIKPGTGTQRCTYYIVDSLPNALQAQISSSHSSAAQRRAVPCGALPCGAALCGAVRCCAELSFVHRVPGFLQIWFLPTRLDLCFVPSCLLFFFRCFRLWKLNTKYIVPSPSRAQLRSAAQRGSAAQR